MKKLIFALTLALTIGAVVVWSARLSTPVRAQAVVIDFENLSPGPLTNQFASLGVTFNHLTVLSYPHLPGFTRSGAKAAEQCFAQEFCTAPIEMSFTSAQRRVKVWVGLSAGFSTNSTIVMRALDANGAQVGQASVVIAASSSPQPIRTPLEVALTSASIRRVLVTFAPPNNATNFLAIDDIEFDSAGPPPPCQSTQNPTLSFLQPVSGQTVQFNNFTLEIRVNSQDTLATALTLTTVGPGGATRSSVLTLNNGRYGPINFNGFLFEGLNTLTARFQDCRGTVQASRTITYTPIPAGTRFELLGIEVTQATQTATNTVPLVANKPAVARVYLRVQPPQGQNVSIREVSGRLAAQRRSGTGLGAFLAPFNLRSLNQITATPSTNLNARRLDFTTSINFELPDEWTTAGDLHLSFRPEIKGSPSSPSNLPCTNCDNGNPLNPALPLFVKFQPTRRLNLILAPYIYEPPGAPTPPLSADLLFTPGGALQWVNNVFPLPGNFPADGSGINLLRILPMRTTRHSLKFGDSSQGAFLSELQSLLASLHSQGSLPSDTRLLAMVPCGCGGAARGSVAFADTWALENGPALAARFDDYGNIWAHELGHTFGRKHAGNAHGESSGGDVDGSFPFAHGGIGQPGLALITEWWNAGGVPYFIAPGVTNPLGPHAHDFMSYGHTDPLNTDMWVSPYTYNALFDKFKLSTRAVFAQRIQASEKLVALGQLNADGKVELQPFYRTNTAFKSDANTAGEFSLVLLDAKNEVLVEHRFDAEEVAHAAAGTLGFTEFVPWHAETQRIVLKRKDVVLAERIVSAHAPTVRVLAPNGGESLGNETTISWEASDPNGDPLSYTVLYNDGKEATWWPLATGITTTSLTIDTALLPGSERGRVKVLVTDGVHSAEDTSDGPLVVPQKAPLVAILNAESDQLTAIAYDPEDGLLPASSLVWTSDRDGRLELGRELRLQRLSPGNHVLTLTVTDSQGRTATAQITKRVQPAPDKQDR